MTYFTISELTKSDIAKQYHIDNIPTPKVVDNLEILTNECLDKIRSLYGNVIYVNCGYRCPQLNERVGGSKTSHHLKGQAADITTGSIEDNELLFNMILKSDISFTQLIDERKYSWIHISYDPKNLKKQVLHLK